MLLEVQHVRKEFQNRTLALTDASFSVSQGDFVSVIGPSGAGKTTLFRILNGSLRCDGGAILVKAFTLSLPTAGPAGPFRPPSAPSIMISHWWKMPPAARTC